MATQLEDRLRAILEEKLNKIIPENIKKGVEIFGVEGNCTYYEKDPVETALPIKITNVNGTVQLDVKAKNKFNINNIIDGVYYDNSGVHNYTESFSSIIELKPNTDYTISFRNNYTKDFRVSTMFYDENMNFVSALFWGDTLTSGSYEYRTYTYNPLVKYLIVCELDIASNEPDFKSSIEIQVEEGPNATEYEPFVDIELVNSQKGNISLTENQSIILSSNSEAELIEVTDLTVTPSGEQQVFNGLYDSVTVNAIEASSEIKHFTTEDEMQADPTAKEGDLAVVYKSEKAPVEVGQTYTKIYLPKTIVFDTAITANTYIYLDDMRMARLRVYKTLIRFQLSSTNVYEILYRSTDGITYTREEAVPEVLTISEIYDNYGIDSITIQEDNYDIAKQIFLTNSYFYGGLFENKSVNDIYNFHFQRITEPVEGGYVPQSIATEHKLDRSIVDETITNIFTELGYDIGDYIIVRVSDSLYNIYAGGCSDGKTHANFLTYVDGTTYISTCFLSSPVVEHEYKISLDINNLNDYTIKVFTTEDIIPVTVNNNTYDSYEDITGYNFDTYEHDNLRVHVKYGEDSNTEANPKMIKYSISKYLIAPSQLNATSGYVYEKEFYGLNGVEKGTLQNTENLNLEQLQQNVEIYNLFNKLHSSAKDLTSAFSQNTNITLTPELDIPNATKAGYMFYYCSNIEQIIISDVSAIQIANYMFKNCTALKTVVDKSGKGFSNLENATYMFDGCTSLQTVPNFTSNKVTTYDRAFQNCTSLVNAPECDFSVAEYTNGMYVGCTSLVSVPNYDLSKVKWVNAMFSGCTSLVTVPQFTISTAEYVQAMFSNCPNLSNESLNNILLMCTTVSSVFSQAKTLAQIGLSEEQAAICTGLPNYAAFTAAGWTTGY